MIADGIANDSGDAAPGASCFPFQLGALIWINQDLDSAIET